MLLSRVSDWFQITFTLASDWLRTGFDLVSYCVQTEVLQKTCLVTVFLAGILTCELHSGWEKLGKNNKI